MFYCSFLIYLNSIQSRDFETFAEGQQNSLACLIVCVNKIQEGTGRLHHCLQALPALVHYVTGQEVQQHFFPQCCLITYNLNHFPPTHHDGYFLLTSMNQTKNYMLKACSYHGSILITPMVFRGKVLMKQIQLFSSFSHPFLLPPAISSNRKKLSLHY